MNPSFIYVMRVARFLGLSALFTPLLAFFVEISVWYADDATATGRVYDLKQWWDQLENIGTNYGYVVNSPLKPS